MVGRFAVALAILLAPMIAAAQTPAGDETAGSPSATSPPRTRANPRPRHATSDRAIATLPGFELLADGSSRLFVQLTRTVPIEEKRVAGKLTYVLRGARVARRNNENALVTVHFNTPVTTARLVPRGHDLHFVVELRDNVAPTWKLTPAKDGASILMIDFPKGDFLPSAASATGTANDAPAPPSPAAGRPSAPPAATPAVTTAPGAAPPPH